MAALFFFIQRNSLGAVSRDICSCARICTAAQSKVTDAYLLLTTSAWQARSETRCVPTAE